LRQSPLARKWRQRGSKVLNPRIKAQTNPSNRYFWRDHVGNEVDLIIDQAGKLTPIELKSGATLSISLYDSLKRFADIAGNDSSPGQLIYGGDRSANRKEGPAHSWHTFKQANWADSLLKSP